MNLNDSLKKEINTLLEEYHLQKLLEKYGEVKFVGSYVYDLMAWRDFDLVLRANRYASVEVYLLLKDIGTALAPDELKILDNTKGLKQNRPVGYWIGIYVKGWKIDLWVMNTENFQKEVDKTEKLSKLLAEVNRDELIKLKLELSKNHDYHIKFSSVDLYYSFLDGVRTVDNFFRWLKDRKAIEIPED